MPQGSVLGLLLFSIYSDSVTSISLSSNLVLYADDILLYRPIVNKADCTPLQSDIDKILNWTTVNLMSFNTSKCKQMIISRKKSQHVASALSLGGQVLEIVNHYISIWVFIYRQPDLLWSYHILHQSQKKTWASFTNSFQAMWIALLWKDFTHHLWDLTLNMVLKYGIHTYKRTL